MGMGVTGMLGAVQTICSSENDFRRGEVKGSLSIHMYTCISRGIMLRSFGCILYLPCEQV